MKATQTFVKCASSPEYLLYACTVPPLTPCPREVAWVVGRKMSVARVDIYTCQCRKQAQEQTGRFAWPVGARSGLESLSGVQGLSPSQRTHLESRGYKISSGSGFESWIHNSLAVRSWASYLTSLYASILLCNETNPSS